MKGLLIKDTKIILQNKRFFIIMLALAAVISIQSPKPNPSFLFGYAAMIFSLLALNTLAYDENDKSIIFLLTMPINRDTYVKEKYIIAFLFTFLGLALTALFYVALHPHEAVDILLEGTAIYITMLLFQMIMIPLRLKFGSEKSGIVLLVFGLIIFVVFGIIGVSVRRSTMRPMWLTGITNLAESFFSLNKLLIAAALFLFVIACSAVSFLISLRIIHRKEF